VAVGAGVLGAEQSVYPRWLGYAALWEAVLLLPGDVLLFFHTGPLAYDGVISYWIPLFGFGAYVAVLSWVALRTAKADTPATAAAP
jgi:hypothetical protein